MEAKMLISSALVFAEKGSRLAIDIRSALSEIGMLSINYSTDINEALTLLKKPENQIIFIGDDYITPMDLVLRSFLSDPIGCLSPVITITSLPVGKKYIQSMGRPMMLAEPLNKLKVKSAVQTLIEVWTKGKYRSVLDILVDFKLERVSEGLINIKAKLSDPNLQSILVPTFVNNLILEQDFQLAEKILLFALKKNPLDYGLLLSLSGLYIKAGSPMMALRLIESVEEKQGTKLGFLLDKAQSYLMLQDLIALEKVMKDLSKFSFKNFIMKDYFVRVLYALGKDADCEGVMGESSFAAKWHERLAQPKAQAS
jgi:hypothetical protein